MARTRRLPQWLAPKRTSSYETDAISGTSAIRDRNRIGSGTPERGMKVKKKMLITTTISRKVVPHRVWAVENRSTSAGVRAHRPRGR